ncbi:MAG: RNA-binding protein [Thermoleophilia bacterium]|nr:RNA-binding protein [Thermoleophilia bacterium]MCZ4495693.1 RNA-binding protein [Thermoleophilia bacterium]
MSGRSEQIGDYVQFVVEQLVDNSEAVKVTESVEGDDLYVDIEVDPGDRGRVIGKNGRLIRSLRVVVRAAAGRDGSTAQVELVEDDEEQAPQDPASDSAPHEAGAEA